jgi:hypothetical protein
MLAKPDQIGRQMKYIRIYTGDDNQSHFENLELSMQDAPIGLISSQFSSENVAFGVIPGGIQIPWHNAPCRQYVILLSGSVDIETGSGERQTFVAGDIMLADDLTGQGHRNTAGDEECRYVLIPCG